MHAQWPRSGPFGKTRSGQLRFTPNGFLIYSNISYYLPFLFVRTSTQVELAPRCPVPQVLHAKTCSLELMKDHHPGGLCEFPEVAATSYHKLGPSKYILPRPGDQESEVKGRRAVLPLEAPGEGPSSLFPLPASGAPGVPGLVAASILSLSVLTWLLCVSLRLCSPSVSLL